MVPDTRLRQVRLEWGITKQTVSDDVGCHFQNYSRIERGEQTPRKQLARDLFNYFEGQVSIGEIYDATHGLDNL